MRGRRNRSGRSTRGGALIIALLVVLVLAIVGLGITYFTQLEDQTSGNIRLAKTAFYSAETGLRTGERALTIANGSGITAAALLKYTGEPSIPLPGGGFVGVPLFVNSVKYLQVILPAATGTTDVAVFSLYIRNNVEDPGNSATPIVDSDRIINLISVGQVWTVASIGAGGLPVPGRLLATKILEEQIRLGTPGESVAPQEGVNESGTNTGQIGG